MTCCDGRGMGKDLSEPRLPAVGVVLATEQRQHRKIGERSAERLLNLGHYRVDPQHPGQGLLGRLVRVRHGPRKARRSVLVMMRPTP
jgi:hypothetical protein